MGVTQRKYAVEILEKFDMMECNSVKVPVLPECKLDKDDKVKK